MWEAKVVNRTEYFVDVEKNSPYQIKIYDEEPIYKKVFYGVDLSKSRKTQYENAVNAVDKATELYGTNVNETLYRGISEAEFNSIQKTCKKHKTV